MASEAVGKFVDTSRTDIGLGPILREMGTMDLTLCLILLGRELRAAHAMRDETVARKCRRRMAAVEHELETRQLTIDDVLLRADLD